jgi:hypothetical protein
LGEWTDHVREEIIYPPPGIIVWSEEQEENLSGPFFRRRIE